MKKVLKIFLGVLFAALLVGTFVFLWQKTRPVKIVYAIEQPKTDTLRQYVVATGKVQPRDEVEIKPQISGIISDVYKEAGEEVRQGEVIATVKVVPEMGQLSSAESRVSVAEISLEQAQREYRRTETLHEKGVVSDEEAEQSHTTLLKAEEERNFYDLTPDTDSQIQKAVETAGALLNSTSSQTSGDSAASSSAAESVSEPAPESVSEPESASASAAE